MVSAMKKSMNLIALIFQSISAVFLFLPWIFIEEYWKQDGILLGYKLFRSESINFFGGTRGSWSFLCYLVLIIMILSVVVLLLSLADLNSIFTYYGIYLPVIALIACIAVTIIKCWGVSWFDGYGSIGHWNIKMGWLLYIVIALQIAAAVLSIVISRKR